MDRPLIRYIRKKINGRNAKGASAVPIINGGLSVWGFHVSMDRRVGYRLIMLAMMIAQNSFPMNTQSATHGLRRHNVLFDTLANCPRMVGSYPEFELYLNAHRVVMSALKSEDFIDLSAFVYSLIDAVGQV